MRVLSEESEQARAENWELRGMISFVNKKIYKVAQLSTPLPLREGLGESLLGWSVVFFVLYYTAL